MLVRALAVALIAATSSVMAWGAELLAHNPQAGELLLIDTEAQTTTVLGSISTTGRCPDIVLDPVDYVVLCVTPLPDLSLYTFSPYDGSTVSLSTLTLPAGAPNVDIVTAFEYIGDVLYVSLSANGAWTTPGTLGTLDLDTGAISIIGQLTGMNTPTGGLAYDNGTLYATTSTTSTFSALYTIDIATGQATKVVDITLGGVQVRAITALEIVDGVAYVKSNDGAGPADPNTVYSLDLTTGEMTAVYTSTSFFASLTEFFRPEPETVPVAPVWMLLSMIILMGGLGHLWITRRGTSQRF